MHSKTEEDGFNTDLTQREHPMDWLVFERLEHNDLPLPKYQTEGAAAFDLAACLTRPIIEYNILTKQKTELPRLSNEHGIPCLNILPISETNIAYFVPLGWKVQFDFRNVLQLHIRSSTGVSGLALANRVGIVDSDYRGDLFAVLYSYAGNHVVEHGQRIVQGILTPVIHPVIKEGKADITVRGTGGFGSTGNGYMPKVLPGVNGDNKGAYEPRKCPTA